MSFGFHTWNDANVVEQVIKPQASAGTLTGTWLDHRTYTKGIGVVYTGTIPGSLDADIRQATDSSGTSAKQLSSSSITQIAATSDNKVVVIEYDTQKLDHANSFYFATVRLVKGNASDVAGALLIRTRAKGMPVTSASDEVVEVLSN